ncbi:MAG: tail fiber domain-containing protein [Acidobacteriota bacterium]|nr:tail fiber domain-containing protein [Acidobacteriota bacterium]
MKSLKFFAAISLAALIVTAIQVTTQAQAGGDAKGFASISSGGSSVRFDVRVQHSGITLTIAAPDGRVFSKEYKGGASLDFSITDEQGERLPDGIYSYELRLAPVLSSAAKAKLKEARGKDDEAEAVRAARKRGLVQPLIESGNFAIQNGAVVVPGATEEAAARSVSKVTGHLRLSGAASAAQFKLRQQHHLSLNAMPDQVIPDDLIVQGSACVGLDCVNGEVFDFDTIRMKENNTRLQFNDTSTAAGFPTNNWQIRANSSASGGASFLAFVDQGATGTSETGTIVLEVDAGAPANALKVSSTGRVGLRTATPVLDLHITTSDTPAHRLEQTNAGGFTAQTWDVAGNEANFFVRDVTGGSRLPFRIRPGAPTSSLDISASGNVGVGTASPSKKLSVTTSVAGDGILVTSSAAGSGAAVDLTSTDTGGVTWRAQSLGNVAGRVGNFSLVQVGLNTAIEIQKTTLNVGIGTTSPTALLSVNGTANKPGGGSWDVFSDERLKNIKGGFRSGLSAVMRLQPLRYEYKSNNALGLKSEGEHVGFGAQTLQKIIPEAVTKNADGYLMVNNDPIIWTMLNAIKEQQKEIEQLKGQVRHLRAARKRR